MKQKLEKARKAFYKASKTNPRGSALYDGVTYCRVGAALHALGVDNDKLEHVGTVDDVLFVEDIDSMAYTPDNIPTKKAWKLFTEWFTKNFKSMKAFRKALREE